MPRKKQSTGPTLDDLRRKIIKAGLSKEKTLNDTDLAHVAARIERMTGKRLDRARRAFRALVTADRGQRLNKAHLLLDAIKPKKRRATR